METKVNGEDSSARIFTAGRFALFLAFLICAAFPDVLFGSKTFVFRDFGLFTFPNAFLHKEFVAHGEWPLWSPYNECGTPFLAQWNTLCLYPLSAIYLLLPLKWSVAFMCLFHLWLSGVTMFFLARRWTGNSFAAAIAGTSFAFCGLSLASLMWPGIISAFAWMPAVVMWVEKALSDRTKRSFAFAGLFGALQMLCGAPEITLITWFFLSGVFVVKCFQQRSIKPFFVFGGVVLFVTLLSAIQILPFLQLLANSARDPESASSSWSMTEWGWANFFVPIFRTNQPFQGVYLQYAQYWASSYYISLGVLLLGLIAALRVKRWEVRALACFAGAGIWLALGDYGYLLLYLRKVIPILGVVRYPVKYLFATAFAVPLLAAFAIAHFVPNLSWRARRIEVYFFVLFIGLIGVVVGWHVLMPHRWPPQSEVLANGAMRAVFLVLTLVLIWRFLHAEYRKQLLFGWASLACIFVDIYLHVPNQNPRVDPVVYENGWVLQALELNPVPKLGESRLWVEKEAQNTLYRNALDTTENHYRILRLALHRNLNVYEGIPKFDGFVALSLNDYVYIEDNLPKADPMQDFVGIMYTNLPKDVYTWVKRTNSMPLITAGQRPEFLERNAVFHAVLNSNFHPRNLVYLPTESKSLVRNTNGTDISITEQKFEAHRIEVKVDARESGLVVLAQSFYPAWKAYVDGQPAPIIKANFAFQAVQVPAGKHTVLLRYEDKIFQLGCALSAIGLLGFFGLIILEKRNQGLNKVSTAEN